jgi:TATA-box binding protein (TBP) (component of TFIID and TFIIIB)
VDGGLSMVGCARVQNIVASANCGFTLRLVDIADRFGVRTSLQMGIFPGLVFRIDDPKIVFLVFRSGSIVITGANNVETMTRIWRRFYEFILLPFEDVGIHAGVTNSAEYKRLLRVV